MGTRIKIPFQQAGTPAYPDIIQQAGAAAYSGIIQQAGTPAHPDRSKRGERLRARTLPGIKE